MNKDTPHPAVIAAIVVASLLALFVGYKLVAAMGPIIVSAVGGLFSVISWAITIGGVFLIAALAMECRWLSGRELFWGSFRLLAWLERILES